MILFLTKLFITQTSILRNSKKLNILKFISHPITKMYPNNIVSVIHIQYSYTLTFKNKSKTCTTSINCQQCNRISPTSVLHNNTSNCILPKRIKMHPKKVHQNEFYRSTSKCILPKYIKMYPTKIYQDSSNL